MRKILLAGAIVMVLPVCGAGAQPAASTGPYHVLTVTKVGGEGGFDYVYANSACRRKLYIPRSGEMPPARVSVFNLDTLEPPGEIPGMDMVPLLIPNRAMASPRPSPW